MSPDRVMTLASFVPEDQDGKLAILSDLQLLLGPVLSPVDIKGAADARRDPPRARRAGRQGRGRDGPAAGRARPARRVLDRLSKGSDDEVARAQDLMLSDLLYEIDQLKTAVEGPTGPATWSRACQRSSRPTGSASGEARLVTAPHGDARDLTMLQRFVDAVRRVAPDATGAAVTVVKAGRTVASAFTRALALAAVASAALLFAVLRRPRDVALVLAPLALAGVLTAAVWTAAGNRRSTSPTSSPCR